MRAQIEAAWSRDALAAQHLLGTEAYGHFIADEQKRLGRAWQARCAALAGMRAPERDLDCLKKAETIDDVQECAR